MKATCPDQDGAYRIKVLVGVQPSFEVPVLVVGVGPRPLLSQRRVLLTKVGGWWAWESFKVHISPPFFPSASFLLVLGEDCSERRQISSVKLTSIVVRFHPYPTSK